MLGYLLSMLVGFWMGISGLLYSAFYWIEEKWDLPITAGDSASSSHAKLQLLIQRVIEEALKLPALLDYSGIERDDDGKLPEFKPKTYEDLLATAILNKPQAIKAGAAEVKEEVPNVTVDIEIEDKFSIVSLERAQDDDLSVENDSVELKMSAIENDFKTKCNGENHKGNKFVRQESITLDVTTL